jgi:integrase/recombinase XerD
MLFIIGGLRADGFLLRANYVLAFCSMTTTTTTTLTVQSIPTITIFVRHSEDCKYRGDESHKACRCPKHFRYTHNGKQTRQSARTRFWKTAEERRRQLEASFAADATAVVIVPDTRKTIERTIQLFITDKRSEGLSGHALKKYERELARFESFMAQRSKFLPHEIAAEDLTEFREGWTKQYPSSMTRGKVQERLKGFLKYCYNARLIDRVPQLSVIKIDEPPTLPLSDVEYTRLLSVISTVFPDQKKSTRVHALIQLMRHTGLSIRDAVTLERSELQKDGKVYRVTTSRQKTGTHVSVPIPPSIAEEVLSAMKLNSSERYMFWNTGNGTPETVVTRWQHDLRQVFRAAGMNTGHPHQLRDTFAVGLLEKGIPLEEVSKLLGHTSIKTTEKHYAPWVAARQARLDAMVIATFS